MIWSYFGWEQPKELGKGLFHPPGMYVSRSVPSEQFGGDFYESLTQLTNLSKNQSNLTVHHKELVACMNESVKVYGTTDNFFGILSKGNSFHGLL